MCDSTVVKGVPESSMWYGAISDEDTQLVRVRHAEKVEEWLDEAEFCTELFKLHEKYGIDLGEEGYADYRDYLRSNYYQKLQTYGPTPNPLDEGCDCIFCKMHAEETPDELEEPAGRLGQVPAEPRGAFRCDDEQHPNRQQSEKKLGPVPAYENYKDHEIVEDHAAQEGHPEISPHNGSYEIANSDSKKPGRLGQVPAESPTVLNQRDDPKQESKKLSPVPAYDDYEEAPDDTSRYDSVGGVEPDWGKSDITDSGSIVRVYPPNPYRPSAAPERAPATVKKRTKNPNDGRLAQVPAESPSVFDRQENRRRRKKRYGPDPVYVKTAGEKAWLKKMARSVF